MKNLLVFILIGIILSGFFGCSSHSDEITEEAFLRDSTQYERFQYFDYYSLTGKEEVTDTPYVFVKREKNRITVRLSDSLSKAYIFTKDGDYWHIRQEYQMEYAGTYPCLCADCPNPRIID
ncbi:MAG: hypothetical protein NC343_08740 [Muribaculum sp.]|nr:hypothetical protein [Muribaculum sp.]MCM1293052.1 hypothetical protein [Bacteroides sp.]MCM1413729.1 hypothetical protein [Bacteroides sp.]MCM1472252.1 hypothetical protein [Bacteroides sp.]